MDLTQTGDVPVNAKLLMIHVNGCLCDPVITINGQSFFWDTLGFYGSVGRFVDVSAWAGQTVTLSISAFEEPGIVVDGLEFIGSDSLTIDPTLLQLQSDRFIITWLGELATKYQVESGTNTPPTWFPVGSPVTSTSRVFTFTDTTVTNKPNSQRFYRLRTVP